jgi:hypothetical protein
MYCNTTYFGSGLNVLTRATEDLCLLDSQIAVNTFSPLPIFCVGFASGSPCRIESLFAQTDYECYTEVFGGAGRVLVRTAE